MLGKGLGPEIDAHDFVIRYSAKIFGYERDVGSKVDMLMVKDALVAPKNSKKLTAYNEKISPSRYVLQKYVPGMKPYVSPITGKTHERLAFGPIIHS